jgi:glycine cleavage system transcriptional repressor
MRHFALSAVGPDRPGIVAAVTGALLEHGVNIEDSEMAILRGHFAMTLVLAAPPEVDAEALRARLGRAGDEVGIGAVLLSELGETGAAPPSSPSHIATVYGADHPGIVHAVAQSLAARGVNITGLESRLAGEAGFPPLYALMVEVALPEGVDERAVLAGLEGVGREQGVEVSLRRLDADAL